MYLDDCRHNMKNVFNNTTTITIIPTSRMINDLPKNECSVFQIQAKKIFSVQ